MDTPRPSKAQKVLGKIPKLPYGVSGAAAGPEFRWGTTSTVITVVLSTLLILSWTPYQYIARWIISFLSELIGGAVLIAIVVAKIPFIRFSLLKYMLRYRGWAYAPRSPFSRFFLAMVSMLGGRKPKLWTFQEVLPPLPVPPLEQTMKTYLRSVQPILSEKDFEQTQKIVKEFQSGVGKELQRQLELRGKTERNWLSDWWEDIVYLSSRYPLPIYSNWYGLDRIHPIVRSQLGRAANFVSALLKFWAAIHDGTLDPNRVSDTVPLCMWQYSRIYGTCRIPKEGKDELEFHPNSRHIAVSCRNQWFKLEVFHTDGTLLTPKELLHQFQRIEEASAKADPKEHPDVAMLTTQERDLWAKQRTELMEMDERNATSIRMIESALFCLLLEDEEVDNSLEAMATHAMHRNGRSMWFDKNWTMTFLKNGHLSCNVDHTWADASTMVHVFDFCHKIESPIDMWISAKDAPPMETKLPEPERAKFVVTQKFQANIDNANLTFQQLVSSIEITILKFVHYGKGIIKRLNMSPDAYCQMAIQLAYYRMHKECALTYESGATFRFYHGRTDTVRSCSMASRAFVTAMEDPNETNEARLSALRKAVKMHSRYMRAATNGDGIDRHLLGLRIIAAHSAKQTGQPMPDFFEDKGYKLDFKLSTSQTPAQNMLGGGFAPLCEDGYGVSYVVAEDRLWFHISAFTTSKVTNAHEFEETLRQCLIDMHQLCFADPSLERHLTKRVFSIMRVD